jgi:hypothetical protein
VVEVDPEERAREMPWTEMRVDRLKFAFSSLVVSVTMISKSEHI